MLFKAFNITRKNKDALSKAISEIVVIDDLLFLNFLHIYRQQTSFLSRESISTSR